VLFAVSAHRAASHASSDVGSSPGQSVIRRPGQATRRVRGPHSPSQVDHSETDHSHPDTLWQASASSGLTPAQPLASPQGHRTTRERTPSPQLVEQVPHSSATQAHPSHCKHCCCCVGPSESSQSSEFRQFVSRCCSDSPQSVPQSDQALASQPQPSEAKQGRDCVGGLPAQWVGSPPAHQTSRCSVPLPHKAEQARHAEACHEQA